MSEGNPKDKAVAEREASDIFSEFQIKEYENISQAHFKTNEVLATFYRYYLLITAIPITTVGLALLNFSKDGLNEEGRILAFFIFGVSTVLLSLVGAAVISYIEGLRLDSILYARVVNSIRDFFFTKPGAADFGNSVLPRNKEKPSYDGFGASYIIYHACALLNSTYFASGVLVLMLDKTVQLQQLQVSNCQWAIAAICFGVLMVAQILIRRRLVVDKAKKGF